MTAHTKKEYQDLYFLSFLKKKAVSVFVTIPFPYPKPPTKQIYFYPGPLLTRKKDGLVLVVQS